MSPPSSRPPAGVPDSGGNAKYAIVAVVLLLAAGGIYAWRTMTNRQAEPAPPPPMPSVAQSASAPTNPLLDDIPPPPPPDNTPEAGGPHIVYVPANAGCDATCSQKFATPARGNARRGRARRARRCYEQALNNDSSLKGHVSIAVRIGPGGNVCSANVAGNDTGNAQVAACAANMFRTGSYPAPRGGCVDANVPLSFVPMGQ
jgi:hypothetical protein